MADERARLSVPRVVILSPESLRAVCADLAPTVECVSVASPYEAAAEIIAEAAMAIVVDLRLMAPRHLRLLQIARERGAEVLAVGGIPAGLTAEDLSGVRLTARADLKAALEAVLRAREGRYEGAVSPDSTGATRTGAAKDGTTGQGPDGPGEYVPSRPEEEIPPRPDRQVPVRPEARAMAEPEAEPPPQAEPPAPRRQVPAAPAAQKPAAEPQPPQAGDLRGILTPDEVAALLEDKP